MVKVIFGKTYQRPYHGYIYSQIPQLLQAHIVLNDGNDVPPDTMDVGINRQVRVGIRHTGEDWLEVELMVMALVTILLEQGHSLGLLDMEVSAAPGGGLAWNLATILTSLPGHHGLKWREFHSVTGPGSRLSSKSP